MSSPVSAPVRRAVPALILCALALLAMAPGEPPLPVFGNPTQIDNPYAPFQPNAVKLFRGKAEGRRIAGVHTHTAESRDFLWNGQLVTCCLLEEREFEGGELVEISRSYLAQADSGAVYMFAEISQQFEEGESVGFEGSWIVGGPSDPDDPQGALSIENPPVFMPVNLEVGDVFVPEDTDDEDEVIIILQVDDTIRVPAGRFTNAIKMQESNGDSTELLWIVPGLGVVKIKEKGGREVLMATTQQAVEL